jgi:hypothetical protein
MSERQRILVLDLLETYAPERNVNVRLERSLERDEWICTLSANGNGNADAVRGIGQTAREAVRNALEQAGVELP